MTVSQAAFVSFASILLLWVASFWLWRDFAVDRFRQRVFMLRDEMFDDAAAGKISFNDAAYGTLRITMNGLIRYAHTIGVLHLLTAQFAGSKHSPVRFGARLKANFDQISPQARELYDAYLVRLNQELLRHIFLSSPLVVCTIVLPVVACIVFYTFIDRASAYFALALSDLDDLGFIAGENEA